MDQPVPITLKDHGWNYKGEGNTNLVVSLSQERIILRLHKTENNVSTNERLIKIDNDKAKREVEFWKKVLIPFFGSDYFKPPLLGSISENEIVELDEILKACRPKHRMKKSLCAGLISIYPDYSFVTTNFSPFQNDASRNLPWDCFKTNESTFCVEIKPKQGWTHPYDRKRKCTFCLNQFWKVEKESVAKRSEYCPLDLFSGNKTRMKKALKNLLKTPQNNLKIFQDGHVVFSDSSNTSYIDVLRTWLEPFKEKCIDNDRLVDKWSDLVYHALRRELQPGHSNERQAKSQPQSSSNSNSTSNDALSRCSSSAQPLPKNCVLNRILSLQKIQNLDLTRTYQLYLELPKTIDEYYYLKEIIKTTNNIGPIERYLLAATAKDCSILIAFHRINKLNLADTNVGYIEDYDGAAYAMNIGVLDLDPKPLSCIVKHFNRDLNTWSAYLREIELNKSARIDHEKYSRYNFYLKKNTL